MTDLKAVITALLIVRMTLVRPSVNGLEPEAPLYAEPL